MKIAVLPGDGIGPEIVAEAVKVLHALGESFEMEQVIVYGGKVSWELGCSAGLLSADNMLDAHG